MSRAKRVSIKKTLLITNLRTYFCKRKEMEPERLKILHSEVEYEKHVRFGDYRTGGKAAIAATARTRSATEHLHVKRLRSGSHSRM